MCPKNSRMGKRKTRKLKIRNAKCGIACSCGRGLLKAERPNLLP